MSNDKLILKLIKTMPNFDCIDDEGNNICHHLAEYGNLKLFGAISKEHFPAWNKMLNQRNDCGDTPLHVAIKNNKQKLAEKYISMGTSSRAACANAP